MLRRRPLDPDSDYTGMVEAQRESWEINFPDDYFSESIFRASVRSAARRGEVFVYELEGGDVPVPDVPVAIIGWLWLDLGRPRAAVHIRHIQVAQEHWGKGFGRQIMEDAMALAVARGARALTLNVTKSNARAMNLYESLGFEVKEDSGPRQKMRLALDHEDSNGL
jgi:ribosomal protein S18 acetylase RimI-like enzyme